MNVAESPLHAYVEAARRRITQMNGPGESSWRDIIDRGFGEAYATADISGLTRVVQLVAHLLEAEGRFDAILAEIDSALTLTTEHPGATASLLALKASVLPTFERADEARATAKQAEELARAHLSGEPRLKALTLAESVRLVIMDPPSPTLPRLISELVAEGRDLDHLFLLSWIVPYLAACGDVEGARAQVRRARAMARSQAATLREADATVFERWLHVIAGTPMLLDERSDRRAHIPAWRDAWLDLWMAILHRNWPAAEIAAATLDRRSARLGSHTGNPQHWQALYAAATGGPCPDGLIPAPVANLTLDGLPANIAAAYAVAIAGSSQDATLWYEWMNRLRRRGFVSCLEVPISFARLQGLLALRAGKTSMARRRLDEAAAETTKLPVEAAIAAVQGLELRTKSGTATTPETRESARTTLAEFSIDPVPHQYIVHHAWDAGMALPARPVLTPRERDVLRELERGSTYKQAAEHLGITWKTVQTLSHRSYEKLGVSNRMAAVAEAHRQELL